MVLFCTWCGRWPAVTLSSVSVPKRDTLSPGPPPGGPPSGFTCPQCGGAMWEVGDPLGFQCRIGHHLSLGGMLAEHGTYRRAKLIEAGRLLAEAAALNRRVARHAHEHAHTSAALQLDLEAAALDQRAEEVLRLAEAGLVEPSQ